MTIGESHVILVPCFALGILALLEGMLRLFNAEFGAPDAKKGQLSRPRSAPVEEGTVTGSIELIISKFSGFLSLFLEQIVHGTPENGSWCPWVRDTAPTAL